jgi:hypothetical protein
MITPTRERRDWTLLVFIIPIGIIFMLIAGQVAIRLVPEWSVNAGMQSNLDPNNLPNQSNSPVQPVLPAILTPLSWLDTFLTPGADTGDAVFPPFIIFEPSATPVVTDPPPTVVTTQPPPTVPTDTPIVTSSPPVTNTQKPPIDPTSTQPTATQPTATQPTATPTGIPSTPPPLFIEVTPPTDLGTATPDGVPGEILPGTYTVVDVSGNPIVVSGTPDGSYDLIYYEALNPLITGTEILMDQVIVGISQDGVTYYVVLNWGGNPPTPDTNTTVDTNDLPPDLSCTGADAPECDDLAIPASELYTPDPSDPSIPQTGILIDVDTAPSAPPEGTYSYIIIISPVSGGMDPAQVDSIVVDEVPIPVPPAAPLNNAPDQPVAEEPASPVDEAPSPPGDDTSPPEDSAPDPPADDAPAPPAEEAPSTP